MIIPKFQVIIFYCKKISSSPVVFFINQNQLLLLREENQSAEQWVKICHLSCRIIFVNIDLYLNIHKENLAGYEKLRFLVFC